MGGEVREPRGRSRLWPSIVLIVLVTASVAAFVVSGRMVRDQEQRLLAGEAAKVEALLANSFDRIESELQVLGRVGAASDPSARGLFEHGAIPLLEGSARSLGVAVRQGDNVTVVAAVGDGPRVDERLAGERADVVVRALRERRMVSELVIEEAETRLILARAVAGVQMVAYQETGLRPDVPVSSSPDSPFGGLRVSLYASPRADPDQLVLTTEGDSPPTGGLQEFEFSVGADEWLLAVGARGSLAGPFAERAPWMFLGGGLLTALLATGIVDTVVRRRRYALDLVAERTRELEQTRGFLEGLLDTGPMAVVRAPLAGGDGYISPSLERLFSIDPKELDGVEAVWERVHVDDSETVQATLTRIAEGTSAHETIEFRLRCGDGSYRWAEGAFVADPNADGLIAYLVDIDDRRRAEDARREAQKAAEAANRSKSEFLSRMSHELRTPLNAVLGFGQLLELEDLSDPSREAVEQILKGGRHLLDLINEVLDISRIEAGDLALSPEAVHVGELVQETVDLIRPLATERDIQLVVDQCGICDVYVFTDRQRAKQILLNLLSNAVKYNRSKGSVAVSCDQPSGTRAGITVADTGPGIPAERLDMLFTPFERLGAEHTTEEGTGIGLALCKRLAEAMGGTVRVASTLGKGSTFTVELPRAEGPVERYERLNGKEREQVRIAPDGPQRRVLHIEDNLSNLKLVERVFSQRPDVEVVAAMQGRLGLELAREHRPALVLLDIHLPDMSGEDVLHRLRDDPATASTPVVIVSADATPGQVRRLLTGGATAYLTKPIEVRQLLRLLDEALVVR